MSLNHQTEIVRKNIPWQELGDQILVLSPFSQKAHELNETAAFIWKTIQKKISLDSLVCEICDSYEVGSEEAFADAQIILQKFKQEDLIEFC